MLKPLEISLRISMNNGHRGTVCLKLERVVEGIPRTKLLYLKGSYLKRFEGRVFKAVLEKKRQVYVVLNRTIFHPKSGGQPSDRGIISCPKFKIQVKKVMIIHDVIIHWGNIIEGKVDEENVFGEIDWSYRYLYMRRHTAGHLLDHCLSWVTGKTVETVNSWLGEPCYVGYKGEAPSATSLKEAIKLGNRLTIRGALVKYETVSREELVRKVPNPPNIYRLPILSNYRLVTIEDCDPILCAGTHLENIKEIGIIVLKGVEVAENMFKVYYDVG